MDLIFVAGMVMALALVSGRSAAHARIGRLHAAASAAVDSVRAAAAAETAVLRREAGMAARGEALAIRSAADAVIDVLRGETEATSARVRRRADEIAALESEIGRRRTELDELRVRIESRERSSQDSRKSFVATAAAIREALERTAGDTAAALRTALVEAELEEARAGAAQDLRLIDQSVNDPEQGRRAKRLMGIAVGRFSGHYLTERLPAQVPLGPPGTSEAIIGPDEAHLRAIETVAGIRLILSETRDAVRLEGLDGVGREVARRALTWLSRNAASLVGSGSVTRVEKSARDLAMAVEREVDELGRRAFAILEIPRSHPDIVKLVGRLNYRTSFTQNQWKHAIEAAFLCGMMAAELTLDVKLARRAALMHDIGKALTHELDGSHAVIGADYARRLGEPEVVANAIGAHHTDEAFSSPYAYLVAAADAMSGARPGARRQMEDNYVAKLADLERITRGFRGVNEAFAVQGGREVRVYVQEEAVDDAAAVALSSEIARRISEEMTFPGQIKVTVIREFCAVETAS